MKTFKRLVLLFLTAILIPANTFPLKITNVDLAEFDSLLKYLSKCKVEELDLSWTKIDDFQLADILNQISGNLRTPWLNSCIYLHDFRTIKNWAQERNIKLHDDPCSLQ